MYISILDFQGIIFMSFESIQGWVETTFFWSVHPISRIGSVSHDVSFIVRNMLDLQYTALRALHTKYLATQFTKIIIQPP